MVAALDAAWLQEKRDSKVKKAEKEQGKGPKHKADKVKGASDGGEAKKDADLVLYEFIAMLVRISFQRCNPTLGNFGDTRELVPLPGPLRMPQSAASEVPQPATPAALDAGLRVWAALRTPEQRLSRPDQTPQRHSSGSAWRGRPPLER